MTIRLSRLLGFVAAASMLTGCAPIRHNLPPAQRLLEPGPGVGGPGPGVMDPPAAAAGMGAMGAMGPGGAGPGGVMPASYCGCGGGCAPGSGCLAGMAGGAGMAGDAGMAGGVMPAAAMMQVPTVQVIFRRPESMRVQFDTDGDATFDSEPLVVPAPQEFPQGALYRLKITNIPGLEGVELYPTLELAPATPRSGAYLAHNAIPIQLTEEDFEQVLSDNFVTKVIYLPDPEFAGPAIAGIDTVVSTRLPIGVDPIVEADRRGTILAILRIGNKDIERAAQFPGASPYAGAAGAGAGYAAMPMPMGPCITEACGGYAPGAPSALPGQVAGITAPQYGMPFTGTPIGLPGPPHIPLGSPAGLQKHVMRNHTSVHMPQPVEKVHIGVRMQPGYSYPTPVSKIHVSEQNINPGVPYGRPTHERLSQPISGGPGAVIGAGAVADPYCPPGT